MVIRTMDRGDIDLAILDGEAAPAGGMGICRQLKAEIFECPPILVLMGREQDAWLASWSQADRAVLSPPDPLEFPETVAGLLRQRLAEHASSGRRLARRPPRRRIIWRYDADCAADPARGHAC